MTYSGDPEERLRRPTPLVTSGPDNVPIGLRVHGRYRIIGELAAGLFGTVCRAEDEATGHEVAVRLLPQGLFGPSHVGARERKGDAIVAASAGHPALVAVLEFGQAENGRDFAAMELVEGRRLSEALAADGPLDVDVALRVAMELGGAIETLHAAGLTHGALRPRNVVVDGEWRVKLLDVELCGLRGERVPRGSGGGECQEYLSLEQIRRSAVTEETDIYAFGVILYEMFTGAPPFQAKTREDLLKKQVAETPVPLRRRRRAVPAAVEAMVALALSKRAERRPTIQNVLNCLWHEINRPTKPWKRTVAIVGGVVLAASIPVLVGWSLLAPTSRKDPPFVPPPAVAPPAAVEAPRDPGPGPIPSVMNPEARPVAPKPAPTPSRSTSPPASPTVSRTPTSERREQTRGPQTPATPAQQQGPAANSNDDPDPGAAVDWLLERAGKRPARPR